MREKDEATVVIVIPEVILIYTEEFEKVDNQKNVKD